MADWEWRCGIVNGIGEALFQVLGDKVRRITRLAVVPPGRIIYEKCMISGVMTEDKEPQYDADKLVICSMPAREQFVTDATMAWSPIQGASGNGRIRM